MVKPKSQFAIKATFRRGAPQCAANPEYPAAIADYLAAYRLGGREPSFKVAYEGGWVRFHDNNGWPSSPVRVRGLIKMTDRLKARSALSKSTPTQEGE